MFSDFPYVQLGQNYEKLVEASIIRKLHLKDLLNFSETRYANSRRQLYIYIRHDLKAIVTRRLELEDKIKQSDEQPWNGKLIEKARVAKHMLRLAGCADVYA